jgi:hypothetical protein
MKNFLVSVSAAAFATAAMSASAWWGAPLTEEQQTALAEQQQAMAEQQLKAMEQMIAAQQKWAEQVAEQAGEDAWDGYPYRPFGGWPGYGLSHPGLDFPPMRDFAFPDIPEMPSFGEYPEMPDFPAFGGYRDWPQMPDFGDYPAMPDLPTFGGYPGIPDVPSLGGYPGRPGLPDLGDYPSWSDTNADIAERTAEIERYREESKKQAGERRAALKRMNEQRRLWNAMRYPHRWGYGHWRRYRPLPIGFTPLQQPVVEQAPVEQAPVEQAPVEETEPTQAMPQLQPQEAQAKAPALVPAE